MRDKVAELVENRIVKKIKSGRDIKPVFGNKTAIVFESSALFVPYLDVALRSLAKVCNLQERYDVIVLTTELEDIDCNILKKSISDYKNISLRFYNPSYLVRDYIKNNKHHYLEINYYRLALPWIFEEYDLVVNLGADIVFLRDISELLNIEFSNSEYMAGAIDLGYIGRLNMKDIPRDELCLKEPVHYVNADVLVFNLHNIRRDFSMDKIMTLWQKYKFRCAEQDSLNVLFEDGIKLLDLRWNVYPLRMTSMEHIAETSAEQIKMWQKALKNPYIVHFAAVPKPWDYPMVGYGELWWENARNSAYYEEIIRRMCMSAVKNESIPNCSMPRRILNFIFPMGSRRRLLLKKIFPPHSQKRKLIKSVYHKLRNKEIKYGMS